ncbi:ubiquitin-conjugating enzyme E2 S [Panthera tigris]|uniref:ubiquitin-conjugating enzyme E2 S n=1 Tax=Panthera tigris TaxID=9694 RepID=UPI001C6F96AE|nr:ubiquitin-conjugating enzyme E2 S [Panthera tigris]
MSSAGLIVEQAHPEGHSHCQCHGGVVICIISRRRRGAFLENKDVLFHIHSTGTETKHFTLMKPMFRAPILRGPHYDPRASPLADLPRVPLPNFSCFCPQLAGRERAPRTPRTLRGDVTGRGAALRGRGGGALSAAGVGGSGEWSGAAGASLGPQRQQLGPPPQPAARRAQEGGRGDPPPAGHSHELQCGEPAPHIIRLVYKEVTTLTADPPDGIKVFPNEEDLTDLQVTIEGPEGTPYAGGLFRMKLLLGKDFPASPPKGYFLTKIFHPNVGANGEICVNVLKRDWTAELGIRHVLLTIKCLLIHPNPESALNEEAGRLLLENYEEYAARARLLTEIHGGASGPSSAEAGRAPGAGAAPSADPLAPGGPGGADGPMAKKHAGERDKKLAAKKKTDKKRALRRL